METAFNILVIILSSFLAIFLILGIIILLYAYKLAKAAKKIGAQAESTVKDAQDFMHGVKNTVAPAFAAKLLTQAVKNFTKRSKVKVKK
ncbi:MAG: hypothetical protein QG623_617 [Patescibacteria group bacterium]|nr:hypothetical protein [Patescibacteria group bacterium]